MRCFSTDRAWVGEADGIRLEIGVASKSSTSKAAAKTFMEKNQLGMHLTELTAKMLADQPEDAVKFLAENLRMQMLRGDTRSGSNFMLSKTTEKSTTSTAGGFTHHSAHLLDTPLVVSNSGQTKLIDLGPGKCTFYAYSIHHGEFQISYSSRDASFFESFVDGWRVEAFCDAVVDSYGLKVREHRASETHYTSLNKSERSNSQAQAQGAKSGTLALTAWDIQTIHVGLADPGARDAHHQQRAEEFLAAAEHILMGRGFPVWLRMFTPSQLLMFKLELFASEWLASHSNILHMMPKNVTFTGILSLHPFSSSMAMTASGDIPSMQLWTLPIGGRVPLAEGLISPGQKDETLDAAIATWRNRIRSELLHANFPLGLSGLWVGIADVYCTDMVMSKSVTLSRIEGAFQEMKQSNLRLLSNLVLVHEIIKKTFDEHAWFLFKRRWKVEACSEDLETSWTLGLYCQQMSQRKLENATHQAVTGLAIKPGLSRLLSPWSMPAGAFFEVPFIAWPTGAALLLDFGTSETGVYRFEPDIQHGCVRLVHEGKLPNPFYDSWVAKNLVWELAETIIKEFKLDDLVQKQGWRRVLLVGGATGGHRNMISEKADLRESVILFLQKVEEAMRKVLEVPICIRLFVPSGEYEAELELRSVQWLMGQTDLGIGAAGLSDAMLERTYLSMSKLGDFGIAARRPSALSLRSLSSTNDIVTVSKKRAKEQLQAHGVPPSVANTLDSTALKDPFSIEDFSKAAHADNSLQPLVRSCSFCGTISAGGGSCQLTLASHSTKSVAQLYSMPIGNRSPSNLAVFPSKGEIPEEKRVEWVMMIRGFLASSFPSQRMHGFFVGISAVYHAAKAAGIADRFIKQPEAVQAFSTCIAGLAPTDVRSISNLLLVREMIMGIFDEDSSFLFKRNWKVGDCTYVAGWTLGLYSSQFDSDHALRHTAAIQVQRCARGWLQRRLIDRKLGRKIVISNV